MRRLLLIFAHPDDEAVFAAGLARRTVAEGGRVGLCTATLGERGKVGDPPRCQRSELAAVRQAELVEAAARIGVSMMRVLGYPDQGLALAPESTIRMQLVEAIRSLRPQVVLTFDPNGSNRHVDHIAISRFACDAVVAAADPRWCPELGAAWRVPRLLWTLPIRPWRLIGTARLASEPGVDFVVDVSPYASDKAAALRAHATQHESLGRILLSRPDVTTLLSTELFRQAWGPELPDHPLDDVFDNLEMEQGVSSCEPNG